MNLLKRLIALQKRQLVDLNIIEILLDIRQHLAESWQVEVDAVQVEMELIHLAMALGRIKRGCCAMALHQDLIKEIESSANFKQLVELHQDILALIPFPIPENEQTHLMANWYSLTIAQPWVLNKV